MQYYLLFLLLLVALALVSRPLTVVLHELGHAIPAILLTKQKVTIYIGSYGDPRKSIKFHIGRLEIFFRYNVFAWRLGICVPSEKNISVNRQIVYTITGPFTSFIVAVIACYFTFTYDMHGLLKILLVVFLTSSILDLLINLTPNKTPIQLFSGKFVYNDGYKLKLLFYYKKFPGEFEKAMVLFNQQRYSESTVLFNKFLTKNLKEETIYRLAIHSNLQIKDYEKAKEISDTFIKLGKMTSDDFSNIGLAYSQLGFHEQAIGFYNESLEQNPDNKYSLNNMGYALNLLNRYDEAIPIFDRAIEIDSAFAYSYNNRGLSKIKTGKTEEGLKDINYSFELDKDNSYGYRNLGIYHLDKGEYKEALKLFTKAMELDSSTHMVLELIEEVKKLLLESHG
ncbi:MAG: tetratricopeptide repeat protein [Chitinophagaceae bacterium]